MKAKFVYESLGDILKPKSEEKIISSLENRKDLDPGKLLLQSAKNGFLYGVKKALEMGADVHADHEWALRCALYYEHYKVIELLLKNGANVHANNNYVLRWASQNGHYNVVELLLKNGADVHASNDWALRVASKYGHTDVAELLKKWMNKDEN